MTKDKSVGLGGNNSVLGGSNTVFNQSKSVVGLGGSDTVFKELAQENNLTSIPIPYVIVLGGVNVTGILYINEQIEDSYTEGVAVGAIIGTYRLDRNNNDVSLYDPTTNLLKLDIILNFEEEQLKARICNPNWRGQWRCSDYIILASW